MAFDSLSERLQNIFSSLKRKGRLSKQDVDDGIKEIKRALLAADVNFKVVKEFVSGISEKAYGTNVLEGLNPGQTIVKIVNEELISLLGNDRKEPVFAAGSAITVWMLIGLQGAGKTTTAGKLAGKFKEKGKKPLLVPCDVYRPAAARQLKLNAEKCGVDFFSSEKESKGNGTEKVKEIVKDSLEYAGKHGNKLVILDTAGRLQIDEEMMSELSAVKDEINVHQTFLILDAMTGQEAVNVAKEFATQTGIDGVILTKLDGDTRGGAALSIRAVTDVPILYAGMGEKISDLEDFYPDRMAGRILGMGDVLSLIEKAEASINEETAKNLSQKIKKASFDFEDYLESTRQMKNLGGLSGIMGMLPGLSGMGGFGGKKMKGLSDDQTKQAEDQMKKMEAMICSMTIKERRNPDLLNPSRKARIARGAGVQVADVNRMVKQFESMRQMMKTFGKGGKKGFAKFPF
ncbi:MAG: signal recognition particle protein [Lachnospiraceae bacterium]|jgi:signal recognition particle subunit SRP54|nr:signal recognition particle protein [Lachnospiraceae bacterium]